MLNRKQSSAAVSAPPAAGAHDLKAGELAALDAKATAALVVFGAVVAGAGWGWSATGEAGIMAVAVVGLPALAYGVSALRNAGAERRRFYTYAQEEKDGVDHNHDTYIGDPFNSVRVAGNDGAADETVIIPKPSGSAKNQPVMDGWGVSAADLVAFAFEVETSRGLKETAWVGKGVSQFILPSGKAVTQKRLRELQAALADHDMASKPDGKWRLDWTAQRIAEHLAQNLK